MGLSELTAKIFSTMRQEPVVPQVAAPAGVSMAQDAAVFSQKAVQAASGRATEDGMIAGAEPGRSIFADSNVSLSRKWNRLKEMKNAGAIDKDLYRVTAKSIHGAILGDRNLPLDQKLTLLDDMKYSGAISGVDHRFASEALIESARIY